MARTKAKTGFGSKLKIGDGQVSEAFVQIGELAGPLSINGQAWDFDDATHMESDNQYREEIPTLKSNAELAIEINYDPTNATYETLLDSTFEAGRLANWELFLPSATNKKITFAGYVASRSIVIPKDGKMVRQVNIKVQGAYTVGAAS